jgi:hypothetical protein
MIRYILLVLLVLLLGSCGTTEEAAISENEELSGIEVDESLYPDWYSDNKLGESRDGVLSGYAKSTGSDPEWAFENARSQANANLRVWIDDQVEEARANVAENDNDATDREFIIQLRNAVATLEFDDAALNREDFNDNGAVYVVVKIETTSTEILDEIGSKLGNTYTELWQAMLNTNPLISW